MFVDRTSGGKHEAQIPEARVSDMASRLGYSLDCLCSQEVCDTKTFAPSDLSPTSETVPTLEGPRG